MPSVLESLIADEITQKGPMPLPRFMELGLYHPALGYYSRALNFPSGKPVRDFVTAPELTPLFSYALANWVLARWEALGRPARWILCEWGPGRGVLMRDLLARLREVAPAAFTRCEVCLWEVSAGLKDVQLELLAGEPVRWVSSFEELESFALPVVGIGNEVMDAFPLRQWAADGREQGVVGEAGDFRFVLDEGELAGEEQVGLRAWLEDVRRVCSAVLLLDYGAVREGTFHPTLQAMRGHSFVSPLADVGEVDLTAHVDFGLVLDAFGGEGKVLDLASFLLTHGILDLGLAFPHEADSLQRLLHPALMGGLFKVFAWERG